MNADVTMAAVFSLSESESEPSEEVEGSETGQGQGDLLRLNHATPEMRQSGGGRVRLNSESQVSTLSTNEEAQAWGEAGEEGGSAADGAPFRGRSQSAPPALWAAQKYGRRLRRMSDEFDSWLDKGEMKKVRKAEAARQMHHSRSWWSYLFSYQEVEVESAHLDNHSSRTE